MTPVSLMPPVDRCSSCEGQKAARAAFQIGEARERQAELQAADAPEANPALQADAGARSDSGQQPTPSSPPPVAALLAPDLAVQASLARPGIEAGAGDATSLQLRGARAYQGL